MKKIINMLGLILVLLVAACTQTVQSADNAQEIEKNLELEKDNDLEKEDFYERIPLIDAYYKGEKIWFIHTDVTSPQMAEMLTAMVDYQTVFAPRNAEAVDITKIAKIYVFTNGVDQTDTKPWGGGPFNFQIDIVGSVPGDDDYTSIRNPNMVTWNEDNTPRILKSEEELLTAESNGELIIKATNVVVNVPIVRWPQVVGSG